MFLKQYSLTWLLASILGICCLLSVLYVACSHSDEKLSDKVVARYQNTYLYADEVVASIPLSLSKEDSLANVNRYIKKWLRAQAIREAAEERIRNLDDRIKYQMKDTEDKLIMTELGEWLFSEELNDVVTYQEIYDYYQQHKTRFISKANNYCFFYVSTLAANRAQIVPLMKSENQRSINQLIEWSNKNAVEYRLDSSYVTDSEIERIGKGFYGNIKKANKGVVYTYSQEVEGNTFHQFFKLVDLVKKGEQLPLVSRKEQIGARIISQRKYRLLKQFESRLIEDAEESDKIHVYQDE